MLTLFWIILGIIVYTYLGYTLLIALLAFFAKKKAVAIFDELPHITLLVAAFNEKNIVGQKVANSLALNYPSEKLHLLWVTDGSDDGTEKELQKYPMVQVLHQPERKGKTAALNRAMQYVDTPIVIFSDANTLLNPDAIKIMAVAFQDPKTGCVAGEKRILASKTDKAAGSGEGLYWKYESLIKTLESKSGSTMGAVGELFALRTELFEAVPAASIIDDFVISLTIAKKGFYIDYTPGAYASEKPSQNVTDEMTRKIRIASGGFQTLVAMPELLNIFKYGLLSIKYLSHKVFRWAIVPFLLPVLFFINLFLLFHIPVEQQVFFAVLFSLQSLFYALTFIGFQLRNKVVRFKFIFAPYYFFIMNLAQVLGLIRFIKGKHSVIWEKVPR